MRFRRLFPLCVLCVALASFRPAAGAVIERILAVVDGRPVMLSEVETLRRVRGVSRDEALRLVIDERLMYREAARLPQAAVSAEEEEQALAGLQAQLGSGPPPPESELKRVARREAAILKYVGLRFSPQIRLDEAELRAAYEEELQGRPGAPSYEEALPALSQRLLRRELDARVEAWARDLRAAAQVRLVRAAVP